ncbi:MAG TPA: YciI family protein [Anaerolineae bacterium]|nr:YciI family protein [Anaerolineae bacterium]
MKYLLLIYSNENSGLEMSEAEQGAFMQAYFDYPQTVGEKTKATVLSGEGLHPTAAATTVRVREGKTLTTDGPFAETKEQLGGYYMVEAENLDEAIAAAALIPSAPYGSIEIRPIMDFSQG